MALREDPESYCLLWLGLLTLGSYYFSFFYRSMVGPLGLAPQDLSVIVIGPLLMVVLFIGYLRPKRSHAKVVSLACGLVVAFMYTLISTRVEGLLLTSWGIGSSVLVAGAISIMPSVAESTSTGMLDTKSLKYPPDAVPVSEGTETGPG